MVNIRKNIIMKDITELKEYSKNNKNHPEEQISLLVQNIDKFGFTTPLLINKKNILIAGHGRKLAAERLGLKELPCIIIDDLSKDEIKALRIADNRLGELAETNWEFLKEELFELKESNLDFLTGYTEEDFNFMEESKEVEEDDFEHPKDINEIETNIKRGNIIKLGNHRLMCGDSEEVYDTDILLDNNKPTMLFTDIPYNVAFNGRSGDFEVIKNDNLEKQAFENFVYNFADNLNRLKIPNTYQCCDWRLYPLLYNIFGCKTLIVWAKNIFGMGRGYRHQHELILFNGNFESTTESDLWQIAKESSKYIHPTQKPVELPARAIKNSSLINETVLDLFGGSGSNLIACEQLNRKCYMMELDEKYCEVICQRWEKLTGKKREVLNGS